MADTIFDVVRLNVASGLVDVTSAALTCVLLEANTWTPSPSDGVVGDALSAGAIEVSTGGSADRQTLTSGAVNLNGSLHRAIWDWDPISYPNVPNATAFDTLLVYVFVTSDSDSWLICAYDLGAQTGNGSPITINPDSSGTLSW